MILIVALFDPESEEPPDPRLVWLERDTRRK